MPKEKTPNKIPAKSGAKKKKGGWFQKIPKDVLLSPGGLILVIAAAVIEILDWIPIPFLDQIWELPLEIGFMVLLIVIVKDIDWKSLLIPFLIERFPIINDILPTWLLKMFL